MIKIPYDELGKSNFQQAVMKLANSPMRTPKAFGTMHLTRDVRNGFMKMRESYKSDIVGKFQEKEEAPAEGSESAKHGFPFTCKQGLELACKAALDGFGKNVLTIERKKIDGALLFEMNEWTPRELEALEFLITEPTDA